MHMSVSRFAGVSPVLHCADALEIQSKCGLESSLVVFRMARPHYRHTRTHRSTVRSCYKTKTLKYCYCCCYTMVATGQKLTV